MRKKGLETNLLPPTSIQKLAVQPGLGMAVYDSAAHFRRVGGREKPNMLETGREWVRNGLFSYICRSQKIF
jgi:hypothetical protein